MNKIFFNRADKTPGVIDRKAVKKFLEFLFENENTPLERLSYIFCSDKYLFEINLKYLNHSTLTDVITFPFSERGQPVYGEVYLSVDRIKENAKTYNTVYQNEVLRVMIHGALHLCGYKDKKKAERQEMRERENYYLNQFSFT
jgi:probable rRNA maturation factor